MSRIPAIVLSMTLACTTPLSAQAQDARDLEEDLSDALRELFRQMQPALDEALDLLQQLEGIDDPRYYEMPELLPNGDIIIRRREDAPPFQKAPADPEPDPAPETEDGTIDL